jgi:hypothetical protein
MTTDSQVTKPTRRVVALLGFLHKAEVDALFRQQPFETADGTPHLELWRRFNQQLPQLQALQQFQAHALPGSVNPTIAEIRNRRTFKEHYESVADYTFVSIPIASLLSPQWYADLDYIEEVAARLKPNMTVEEQLGFAMSEGKITEPIIQGNLVLFTSPRRDLFATQIPNVKEIGEGEFEISVRAASRPNYIQVAQIGNQFLLTNGVHKVCALHEQGYTHCVCLLRTAARLEEVGFQPNSTSLFNWLGQPRPPLVIDFLNSGTAAPLKMRPMYQVLQIQVSSGTLSVPALQQPTQSGIQSDEETPAPKTAATRAESVLKRESTP